MKQQQSISNFFTTSDTFTAPDRRKRLKTEEIGDSTSNHDVTSPSRASKYRFDTSQSLAHDGQHLDDDAHTTDKHKQKLRLHQRFVEKLGHPDSIVELKRRTWHGAEDPVDDVARGEPDGEDADDGVEGSFNATTTTPKHGRGAVVELVAAKKTTARLTPMEKQMLEIKRKHIDTLLVIEVGYKFRFFGEDARVAAKELSIVCIPGKLRYDAEHPSEAHLDRFASASIPVHRLHVHVKRLVAAGHKVGVVRQLETAALKAVGDNRNTPFTRKLTNIYTKGTYVDDVEGLNPPTADASAGASTAGSGGAAPATGYLLCLTETNAKAQGTDEKVHIGMVAVQPNTGDVIYDDFEDGFMRTEIETRLLHIAPCELLIVGELSKATEKLVQHLSSSSSNIFGDRVRVERMEKSKMMPAQAYSHVSSFYAGNQRPFKSAQDETATDLLDKVLRLSEHVTCCLSAMITHMSEYGLEHVFDLTKYFHSFKARSHMLLNGNTLTSLEIYRNQTDYSGKGSLFWTLDRTKTRFGQRLLRKWVGRPLLDKDKLQERVAAVEELKQGGQIAMVEKLKSLLSRTKCDLERGLIRIYYGKCTRPELLTILQTMQRIANEFASGGGTRHAGFETKIINDAVSTLPTVGDVVVAALEKINAEAARADDKCALFRENEETDEIADHKLGIASVEQELDAHRAVAAEKLRRKRLDYVKVAGVEVCSKVPLRPISSKQIEQNLIEVENTQLKHVPASWLKISGTKKQSRFHTPEVVRLMRQRDQHREALAAACDAAFAALLASIAAKYQTLRDCVLALACLDCLLSLADVASQPGYVKPEYTDGACISVTQGRHPMVEQLLLDTYVANDIALSSTATRALLITGPNMGGKSSYVRQIALIAIMGQIGSYVPAASAKLGMLDAVFTRMGAFDNMMAGESTFMVELSETSDILKQASSRSLVILDELGRGTSTHDGVAIAHAVLEHVVREVKCMTLFVTHYQTLSQLAGGFEHEELKNVHMRFAETGEGGRDITFLYEIGEGVAHRSYGLNVARLANIPQSVLDVAAIMSQQLEEEVKRKRLISMSTALASLTSNETYWAEMVLDVLEEGIEQL
ncbi:MAG: Mismatch repair protein msh3 [Piccolia ochrophora]|nr:MAG: Mismatch repair protein msh3 [Piccolia ochrophora]